MRYFGQFLSNLRSSANLSLEELAKLTDTSRSTISRIENSEVSQPFKGSIRKLFICAAEILCTSRTETERYLNLANIDKATLPEIEQIQLGFIPKVAKGSPDELTTPPDESRGIPDSHELASLLRRDVPAWAFTRPGLTASPQADTARPTARMFLAALYSLRCNASRGEVALPLAPTRNGASISRMNGAGFLAPDSIKKDEASCMISVLSRAAIQGMYSNNSLPLERVTND